MHDGIYYVTMGSTLDYSCKNNKYRPNSSPDYSFAILKIGNPDPEKIMTLAKTKRGNQTSLKTSLIKQGCFGNLDKLEWFLNGKKLSYDNRKEILLTTFGTYKAVWSNCLGSIADSVNHTTNEQKVISLTVTQPAVSTVGKDTAPIDKEDISVLLKGSDKFVLKR